MVEPIFDAPVPGNSLTKDVNAQPWKNPPQYNTVEEAIDFYIDRMTTDEFTDKLVSTLNLGIPVTQIANLMQIHGVMEGRHTLDVSMLILPVIMEFIRLIADTHGIYYDMGIDDYDSRKADTALVAKAVEELQERSEDLEEEEDILPVEEMNIPEEDMAVGLMARRE